MLTYNTELDDGLRKMVIWAGLLCEARDAGRSSGATYGGAAATAFCVRARRRGSVRSVAGVGAAAEAVVDGLAAFEAGLEGMPVLDGRFAETPAKENNLVIDTAGKIEEAGFKILDLDTDGVDFRDGLADALEMGLHLCADAGDIGGVDAKTAGQVNALGDCGESGFDIVCGLLSFLGAFKERLKHREE